MIPAHFSPGISLTSTSGSYSSGGETGSITCAGTIHGHVVTGSGSFGFEGTYKDATCISHHGSGTSFFTVPTDAGPVHVSGGSFSESSVGINGTAEASHSDPGPVHFVGTYVIVPTQGTCATTPMTHGLISMTGVLS